MMTTLKMLLILVIEDITDNALSTLKNLFLSA